MLLREIEMKKYWQWVWSEKKWRGPSSLNLWNPGCPEHDFYEKNKLHVGARGHDQAPLEHSLNWSQPWAGESQWQTYMEGTWAAFTLGAQARCPMGTDVNTSFFLGIHTRIQAQCQCPSIRSRPCTQAQKWALGPCVHTIFVSSLQSIPLFSLLSSYFKVASDRVKWSNYVHMQSYIGYSKCEHNTILSRYPGTGS